MLYMKQGCRNIIHQTSPRFQRLAAPLPSQIGLSDQHEALGGITVGHATLGRGLSVTDNSTLSSRWSKTFAQSFSLSDLKSVVKRNTVQSPCNQGLRSVCWKVGAPEPQNLSLAKDQGIPCLREPRSKYMAQDGTRLEKCIRFSERTFRARHREP